MLRPLGILALCVACGSPARLPAIATDQNNVEFATTSPGDTSAEVSLRVSNPGGLPTPAVVTGLAGQDPGAFLVTSDGCAGAVLAPAGSCDVRLAFRPSEQRQYAAELRIAAGPASATVAITGRAEEAARLSISKAAHSFAGVELGQSSTTFVTVSNDGSHTTAPLSFDAAGDTGSFLVGGNCMGRALAPGSSCDLQVTFSPRNLGPGVLSLVVLGSRYATVRAVFDGYGKRLVTLTVSKEGDGNVAVAGSADSCVAQPCRVRFEIGGPPARAILTATPGATSLFTEWVGGCPGSATSCELAIDGDRSVVARFVPAVMVTFEATSLAAGTGVIAVDSGASCAVPCRATARVQRGARVRFSATPDTGSQFRWTNGCSGTNLACEMTVSVDTSATIVFNGANYAFVASKSYPTNLGIAGYDDACNASARTAGLPGPYVAWLSTSKASASSRMGSARSFIRVDGRPFADTLEPGAPIYFPLALDEFGNIRTAWPVYAMTGSDELGQLTAGYNCSDWTLSGSYGLRLGDPMGGAGSWSGSSWTSCQGEWLIYCLGTGIQRPLQRQKSSGRLAFVSSNTMASGGGLAAADSLCASEARAAGLTGSFKALLATDGASAASRFDLRGPPWIRADGVAIVDKAADLARWNVKAPIDVSAAGAYDFGGAWAWAGALTPGEPGTAASTCASWRSTAADAYGRFGAPTTINPNFPFGAFDTYCNGGMYRVYCLEE